MENEFQEELRHNKFEAWFGYIRRFSLNCYFVFKHIAKGQRTVRCRHCHAKIPKTVPRIFISGSWYYYTGHYCLKCALQRIQEDINEKEELRDYINKNLVDLQHLAEILSNAIQKEAYKDGMAIGVLCAKIEPRKEF